MTFTLRPYQEKIATEVWDATERKRLPTVVVLPTGGGKTKTAAKLAELWGGTGRRTWIFAHRRELIGQWSKALLDLGVSHGVVAPGRPMTGDLLQVCSIDTVLARLSDLAPKLAAVDRLIVDEAHHVVSVSYRKVHDVARSAIPIGVTATPYRLDGNGLGDIYKHVVRGPTMRELIDAGSLAPFAIYQPPIKLDLTKVRSRAADYVVADLVSTMDRPEITETAVAAYRRWLDKKPTVVFCVNIEHAEHVAAQFSAAGYRAASIDGTMTSRDRDAAIAGIGNGRLDILTSCAVISEGTDLPVVAGAIMLRPTQSTALWLQQAGRCLRPAPGKDRAIILDCAGNTMAHGMPDADRKWTLQGGIKGMERLVSATRRCRHCCERVEAGPTHCPSCGKSYGLRIPPPPVGPSLVKAPKAGSLGELTDKEVLTASLGALLKVAKDPLDLMRIARVRGYKAGWADHIARERGGFVRRYA